MVWMLWSGGILIEDFEQVTQPLDVVVGAIQGLFGLQFLLSSVSKPDRDQTDPVADADVGVKLVSN